jgi:hypothetical protein
MRLPRNLKPAAVSDINHRLRALQPSLQAPKGPIPRNVRQPKIAQAEGPLSPEGQARPGSRDPRSTPG